MRLIFTVCLAAVLLLSACVPIQPPPDVTIPRPTPPPVDEGDADLPEIARLARAVLAEELGIDAAGIQVTEVEAVNWPDGCLGIYEPDVMCVMVITPGYRIVLTVDGRQYVLHTDQSGNTIKLAPSVEPGRAPVVAPTRRPAQEPASDAPAAVTLAASAALAAEYGLDPAIIEVTEVEAVEWPDACLGVYQPDEMCAMVITPGYRIVLTAAGETYVLHTDARGEHVRVAEAPAAR